jgi:hypothetical protein
MIKPTSVMVYAPSGYTKTSQMYFMAKYIRETTGKIVRLIHSDPGGYAPFVDSGMIARGEIQVIDYSNRQFALADFRRLSMGYWPRLTTTGEEYFASVPECMTTPAEWGTIGGYIIDGISAVGELLKNHCSDQDEGVGFKPAWKYVEDGITITGLQEGHYGLVQKEIHSRHTKGFASLPIPWLCYTALLGKGEDKQKRETVYGPQIVGNASTPQAPSWFWHCLHLSKERYLDKTGKETEGMVAWFIGHNDPNTQVPYLCKCTILPDIYPKLLECFPYGFVPLGYDKGIDVYFKVLDVLRKKYLGENK